MRELFPAGAERFRSAALKQAGRSDKRPPIDGRPGRAEAVLVCLLALCLGGCASAPGATDPHGDGHAALREESATGLLAPPLDIRMDFRVVDRFLAFLQQGSASAEELDRWVNLPGNRELLRLGSMHGDLTPELLKEAMKVTLSGQVFPGAGPLGRLEVGPWDVLREMVRSVEERQSSLGPMISSSILPYLPPDRPLPPLNVCFHLGGEWDGRTSDAVYLNLTFFQARGPESVPGLDALLVHEVFHLAQGALLSSVEDYTSPQSALFTTLLRTQQEGIARHLEYRHLKERVPATSLDRTNFQKYGDGLRHASEEAARLEQIREAAYAGRLEKARMLALDGFVSGGPLYAVGHFMANEIETRAGREALAATVPEGPIAFFDAYERTARAAGRPSILSREIVAAVQELKRGYARAPAEVTHLRRQGLTLMRAGTMEEAIRALRRVVRVDPSDAVSAYNLACAYALTGSKDRALSWLMKSIDRGFDRYKHIASDPDLDSLRGERAFAELLRRHGISPDGSAE